MITQLLLSPEIQPFKVRGYSPQKGGPTGSEPGRADPVFRKSVLGRFARTRATGSDTTVHPIVLIVSSSDLGSFGVSKELRFEAEQQKLKNLQK